MSGDQVKGSATCVRYNDPTKWVNENKLVIVKTTHSAKF